MNYEYRLQASESAGSLVKTMVVLIFGVMLSACSSTQELPRMRLGSIPFPGPFTLYDVADPHDLGTHRYEEWWDKHDGPPEVERGILYSRMAGFLDLSHIRESADIVKYAHDRIAERIASGRGGSFHLDWSDSRFIVSVRLPKWWWDLGPDQRAALAREASIRQAQRFAIIVGAWHELGTWYGQMTIPPISEKNSAFTWDDSTSHVVAAIAAGAALRDTQHSWNAAMTRALQAELNALGVVDIDCESNAVERVHGRWWWNGTPIRRDLDIGLDGNAKKPWLVPGLECVSDPPQEAAPLPVADLLVDGHDLGELFRIQIKPERWLMRKALGRENCPETLDSERDLLDAIEQVRLHVRGEFGPDGDRP